MAFSIQTKLQRFIAIGGRCECARAQHMHPLGRCNILLDIYNRALGQQWEAHHRTADRLDGGDGISNCEILCIWCHQNTVSFGRS